MRIDTILYRLEQLQAYHIVCGHAELALHVNWGGGGGLLQINVPQTCRSKTSVHACLHVLITHAHIACNIDN